MTRGPSNEVATGYRPAQVAGGERRQDMVGCSGACDHPCRRIHREDAED